MTVYVDDMYKSEIGKFGRMKMSHMMADTHSELIDMTNKIGVNEKWIQNEGRPDEHFDICFGKRLKAVELGAVELTMREMAKMNMARRKAAVDEKMAER
jgi:hypothetical protein